MVQLVFTTIFNESDKSDELNFDNESGEICAKRSALRKNGNHTNVVSVKHRMIPMEMAILVAGYFIVIGNLPCIKLYENH